MSDELKYLSTLVACGKLDRRSFLGRAAALGAAAFAPTILASAARAEGPVKGGTMRVGLGGGQATDTLDLFQGREGLDIQNPRRRDVPQRQARHRK